MLAHFNGLIKLIDFAKNGTVLRICILHTAMMASPAVALCERHAFRDETDSRRTEPWWIPEVLVVASAPDVVRSELGESQSTESPGTLDHV